MSQLKPLTWNEYISSDASVYRFSESQCVGGAVHLSNFYVRKSGLFVIDGLTQMIPLNLVMQSYLSAIIPYLSILLAGYFLILLTFAKINQINIKAFTFKY